MGDQTRRRGARESSTSLGLISTPWLHAVVAEDLCREGGEVCHVGGRRGVLQSVG
jgi:hypothetical protein